MKAVRSMPDKMFREAKSLARESEEGEAVVGKEFGKARKGNSRREVKRLGAAAKQNEKIKKSQAQLPPCPDCSKVFANKDSLKKTLQDCPPEGLSTRD